MFFDIIKTVKILSIVLVSLITGALSWTPLFFGMFLLKYPKGCGAFICGLDFFIYATAAALALAAACMITLFQIKKQKPQILYRVISAILIIELLLIFYFYISRYLGFHF